MAGSKSKEMIDREFEQTMEIESIKNRANTIWNKFRALFPNSPEKRPVYTEENIKRWEYHIREAEKNQGFEKVELDMSEIEEIRAVRGVRDFDCFDPYQKASYLEIAKCFPGCQVFACGSQVRGDSMQEYRGAFNELENVKETRKKAGMRTDRFSDYDFWVEHGVEPTSPLPNYADRFRGKFSKEMVPIPIFQNN